MKPNERFKDSNGGGFLTALYDAYCRADSGNARRIEEAFPDLFELTPDDLREQANKLIMRAVSNQLVVEIELKPVLPLAMGNYVHVVNVRQARSKQ